MEENIETLYRTTNDSTIVKNYDINIEDSALTNENIVYGSFSINEKLCSSDTLTFGECNARMLKLQVAAELGDISGKILSVTQTISKGNITGQIGLGEYNIDSATLTANKKYRDIVAYDNIILFSKNVASWYENLTFPITLYDMFKSLCTFVGVGYEVTANDLCNASMLVEKTITGEYIKGITVLKCIAELNGGFFVAKSDYTTTHAPIVFIKLSNTLKETFDVSDYKTIKKEDFKTEKITKLVIRSDNDDIGAASGTGSNAYIIEDNFLVYGKSSTELTTIVDNIYPVISNIEYVPYTATQIGLPYLNCGDTVKYKLADNSTFTTIMLQRTLSGTQILKDEVVTSGSKVTENVTGIAKEIIKLKGKANILKRSIEETLLQIENIEQGFTSQIKQTEDSISALIKGIAVIGNYGIESLSLLFASGSEEEPLDAVYSETYDYVNITTEYLWVKVKVEYSNGTVIVSKPMCITNASISSIKYYISSSKVEPAGGTWTTTLNIEEWAKEKYIWIKISYTNLSTSESKELLYCDTSWETPVDLQALLDVKIDKEQLISEINASADIIRLVANRLIIDSSYFKLDAEGNMQATSGKIGGWQIGDKLYSSNPNAFINPGYYEWDLVEKSILGSATLTTEQRKASDLSNDGSITLLDSLNIRAIIEGTKTISDIANQYGYVPKLSTLSTEINPLNPDKIIRISGKNSWGRDIDYYFGADRLKTGRVFADCVSAGIVKTDSGADLDELNSNLLCEKPSSTKSGFCWKFPNNLLIQTYTVTFSNVAITNSWGNLYESALYDLGTFQKPFIAIPWVFLSISKGACFIERSGSGSASPTTSSAGKCYFVHPKNTVLTEVRVHVLGIERYQA